MSLVVVANHYIIKGYINVVIFGVSFLKQYLRLIRENNYNGGDFTLRVKAFAGVGETM